MNDSFERQWKSWRQRTPPFESYRFGNRSAPTYDIECALDHVRTSVDTIVRGLNDAREWPFQARIEEEIGNLSRLRLELSAMAVDEGRHMALSAWIHSTQELLRSLDGRVVAAQDRRKRFPSLTRHTPAERVAAVLVDLLEGRVVREDVAEWASAYVRRHEPPDLTKNVWLAVERMAGADSPTTDRAYLYGEEDFEAWLRDLVNDGD
jgi:hypothetical protein